MLRDANRKAPPLLKAIVPVCLILAVVMAPAGGLVTGESGAPAAAAISFSAVSMENSYLDVPSAIRNMYHPQRFPDIYILARPYCLFTSRTEYQKISKGQKPETVAGHGSCWNYDADVPIIFYGKGIKEGYLGGTANLTDIAPTLAYLAGVQSPAAATGRVLHEILRPEAAGWNSAERPKVLVLFSLDQCRREYLSVYSNAFSFLVAHIIPKGASFAQGRVPNAKTETAVSHASVGTGTIAGLHGIVGNNIMQTDNSYPLAIDDGNAGPHYGYGDLSPRNLLVPTLADEMDLRYGNESIILCSSSYGRAAIGIAGHGASWKAKDFTGTGADKDIVFVTNWRSGAPYTNTDYFELPDYLDARINPDVTVRRWLQKYYGIDIETASWSHNLKITDKSPYAVGEKTIGHTSAAFPWGQTYNFNHPIIKQGEPEPDKLQRYQDYVPGSTVLSDKYSETVKTPFFDLWNFDLNLIAMEKEKVGRDNVPDLVFFHLKSLDSIGHKFGIYSGELFNYMFFAGYLIEKVIRWLDANVGAGNYTAVFFGDHGAAQVTGDGQWVVREDVQEALESRFGNAIVRRMEGDQLWLNQEAVQKSGASHETIARWMESHFPWVVRAFTKGEVRTAGTRR